MTYRFPIHVGDRVALAPHTDYWMQGVRFGTVTSIGGEGSMGGRFYFIDITGLEFSSVTRNITLNEEDLLGAVGDRPVPESGTVPEGETEDHGRYCAEYDDTGSCSHPSAPQHEMTLCIHEDCGYGDCSWLQDSPVPGTCNTHGNGEGRCQREGKHDNEYGFYCPEFDENGGCIHSEHMALAEGPPLKRHR